MKRKTRLSMASIFLIWILVCMAYTGVAEGWATKERLYVVVGGSETEIIEPTLTNKQYNRKFFIENGENEIIATAWGSNDQWTWEIMETKTISPDQSGWLILGFNHWWHVKLTGKTTSGTQTSIVDATLYYRELD